MQKLSPHPVASKPALRLVLLFVALFLPTPVVAQDPVEMEVRDAAADHLSIQPLDLRVRVHGGTAVVTFHLGDEPPFARRTLVFARDIDRWRVIHLHASGAPPTGG